MENRYGMESSHPKAHSFRQKIRAYSCIAFIAIIALSACGGSGSSAQPEAAAALSDSIEGTWHSNCYVVTFDLSARNQLDFTENTLSFSTLFFQDSEVCTGDLNFQQSASGIFSFPGGTTQTGDTTARHIDILYTDATAESTPEFDAFLALSGQTAVDFADEVLDIRDINNVDPLEVVQNSQSFTLLGLTNGVLTLGDNRSNAGDSPETRLTELSDLSSDIYTR